MYYSNRSVLQHLLKSAWLCVLDVAWHSTAYSYCYMTVIF